MRRGLYYDFCRTVGSSTRVLTYSKINPIPPVLRSSDSDESAENSRGANSRKMNEISPRMMYSA